MTAYDFLEVGVVALIVAISLWVVLGTWAPRLRQRLLRRIGLGSAADAAAPACDAGCSACDGCSSAPPRRHPTESGAAEHPIRFQRAD